MVVGQILDENEAMTDYNIDKMNSSNIWVNIELKSKQINFQYKQFSYYFT